MQYTLQETARLLGIDSKTLKRKLQRAQIVPTPDDIDRRRMLLSEEQLARLAQVMGRTVPETQTGSDVQARPAEGRAALEGRLARLSDEVQTLRRRMAALEDEIRVLRLGLLGLSRDVEHSASEVTATDSSLDG